MRLVVGLEVRREFLVGELRSLRRAMLPVVAAGGGVVVPALIYLWLNHGTAAAHGWSIPIATDVAFSLAVLGLFRSAPPGLRVFLVTLAVVDDMAGVIVIGLTYTQGLHLVSLALAILLFGLSLFFAWRRVQNIWLYAVLGLLLWREVTASGVHATIAGILLAMAVPFAAPQDGGDSVALRIEEGLHPWVSFGVIPIFALANAGIPLSGVRPHLLAEPVFAGVFLGLLLGKPIGITLSSWIAVRLGLAELPAGATWAQLHSVAWLGGIGFTVSIFIAGLAFAGGEKSVLARMAVLFASAGAAMVGAALLKLTVRRPAVAENPQAR